MIAQGKELATQPWVLPLPTFPTVKGQKKRWYCKVPGNHGIAQEKKVVGAAGFEPAASCSQGRRDNRATLRPDNVLAVISYCYKAPAIHALLPWMRFHSVEAGT